MTLQSTSRLGLGLLLLTGLWGLAAIDGRALWTDEIGTWELTQPATWQAWWQGFWHHYNSDGQLPIYHAYMHAWVRAFGDDEVVLRISNLPWLALALWGMARIEIPGLATRWLLVAAVLNAFVWYYLNDARPYVIYMAGACWMSAGMVRSIRSQAFSEGIDQGLRECLLGATCLLAGTVLGAFWILSCAATLVLLFPVVTRALLRSALKQWPLVALTLTLCGVVLAIAVHSHLAGARANQTAEFSLAGMAYGLVELVGAAGLGPSRNDLRVNVLAADRLQMALMLSLAVVAGAVLFWAWLRAPGWRLRLAILIAAGAPLLAMVVLGVVLHWRVVGRHLSAVLPVLLIGFACWFQHAATLGRGGQRLLACLLAICMLVSSALVRWAPRHMKDDYRQASHWAKEALGRGQSVLWLADQRALRYYGLSQDRTIPRGPSVAGVIPFSEYPAVAASMPFPDVVIFSPREGVDPGRLARPVLESGRYVKVATAASFDLYTLSTTP